MSKSLSVEIKKLKKKVKGLINSDEISFDELLKVVYDTLSIIDVSLGEIDNE